MLWKSTVVASVVSALVATSSQAQLATTTNINASGVGAIEVSAYEQRVMTFARQVPLGDWSCRVATNREKPIGRMAYLWAVGHAAGKTYPETVGYDWSAPLPPSETRVRFDESITAAFDQACEAAPNTKLSSVVLSPRQLAATARVMRVLSAYRWDDLAALQDQGVADAQESYVTMAYLMDGFLAGQYKADRHADNFVIYKAPEWLCESFDIMSRDADLSFRQAALEFIGRPSNVYYHNYRCTLAGEALLARAEWRRPVSRPLAARSAPYQPFAQPVTAAPAVQPVAPPPAPIIPPVPPARSIPLDGLFAPIDAVQQQPNARQRLEPSPYTTVRERRINSQHEKIVIANRANAARRSPIFGWINPFRFIVGN